MNKQVIKHFYNTRVYRADIIRTANMIFENTIIGTISEEKNDAGEFDWVIRPNWENLEKVSPIQIAGIDMDLHLDEYIRRYIPAFVEERTLPDNREGVRDELEKLGLNWNDRFEYMCRTHGLCGPSPITVERKEAESE